MATLDDLDRVDCEATLRVLRNHIDRIEKLAARYPVVLELHNRRWIFCSRADVERLIEQLADRVERTIH